MAIQPEFDSTVWASENFGNCDLGDARRTRRLEHFARQVADRPAATLPKIGEDWGGTKGIYRLLDREEVTLSNVTQTHRDRTLQHTGRLLVICDTTHVDFGWKRNLPDAGPIGPGRGQGFLLHSGLLVDTADKTLVGLAGQRSHIRSKKRKGKQNQSQLRKRWRESEMWVELMEQIGSPVEGAEHIYVCDSAADNIEVFCTAQQMQCDVLIRGARLHRHVLADGEEMPLSTAISGLEELGRYELEIGRGNGRQARKALLRVSARNVEMPIPRHRSQRVKKYLKEGGEPIRVWAVVVEEVDPPKNSEPIYWVLLTTVPVASFKEAWDVIGWYEDRWLVEEWHKALKTGCQLEARQLQSIDRLQPLAGVLSVVAVLLVQLKHAARTNPKQRASETVPALWLRLLKAKRKIKTVAVTNYEFWRAIAKLGGFLGRRHDGEPGWQTIWRGWKELHTLAEGVRLAKKCG